MGDSLKIIGRGLKTGLTYDPVLSQHAEVRVTTKDEPIVPPPAPGERYIRWRGPVPPQKWMNFYTKVLSKYATSSELRLEVSFEVKVDREQAVAKAGETKSALRELGLDDQVSSGQ